MIVKKYEKEYHSIKSAVELAGFKILEVYNSQFKVKIKLDFSPVTKADLIANDILVSTIKKDFPMDGIISEEEHTNKVLENKRIWIIDPLDGTKDFVKKTDEFSIMVGLIEDGIPVFAMVYAPVYKKLYYAFKGSGSYLLQNSKVKKLKISTKINSLTEFRQLVSRNHFRASERKISESLGINHFIGCGSIGVKLGLIAQEEGELYYSTSSYLGEWDTCAPQLILEEAGGFVCDLKGNDLVYNTKKRKMKNGFIALCDKKFKDEILSKMK